MEKLKELAHAWLQENATMYRGNNASDCMVAAFIAGALAAGWNQKPMKGGYSESAGNVRFLEI